MKRLLTLALAILALGACEVPTEPDFSYEVSLPRLDTCLGIGMTVPCGP